jgi:amino acid adenylation domain-containing protein
LLQLDEPTWLANTLPVKETGVGHKAIYTHLDAIQTERLNVFARSQRVTLNTLVQGAWLMLLARYTGQRCVTFGATVAGRPASLVQSDRMMGLFINTLPVIQQIDPQQTVGDWLRALQDYNLELREREYTPLADIQRWAGQGGRGLFDSIIVFENYPIDQALEAWSDDTLSFGASGNAGLTNFPMDLMVTLDERLHIEYMYLQECFDAASVEGIRSNMEGLLQRLADSAQQCLGEIGLPTGSVRSGVLPFESDLLPVHRRIEQWAVERANEVAVIAGQTRLTFGELEQRANRLAHALIAEGVGPEVRVGVALPRNEQMIVALLAVLKARGAYVPLDSNYPQERLAYLMRDSGVALLLSDSRVASGLPVPDGLRIMAIDQLALENWPNHAPVADVHPESLAYVIYTSGSTGQPKGVAVAHGPLSMHCQAVGQRYEMTPADCELHFMSFAFDGAHERWLTTLTHGGRLLLRDDSLWTPQQTHDAMHEHGVSVAAFPPAYLQQLAEHVEREGSPAPVRIYCFGGDAVPQASFELAQRVLKPQFIINGYGPTETVVTPLIWKADANTDCGAAYAPIGSLVGGRTAWVMDADMNPLPVGMAGELYLGGEGLARGYLDRAGITAERFVADPFSEQGGRLYRTGDLVSQRPDGTFDYLGRIDNQVKIRGFRIELGEIEARLRECPGVRDAVVVAHEAATGKQLAGYLVAHEPAMQGVVQQALALIKEQLPDYMVPTHLLLLPQLPLTPNGKLDRKALPVPLAQASNQYVAPLTELEQALAKVWQDVLKIERVGMTDNFFELGGDSILSLQVLAKSRSLKKLGFSMKLRDLMQKPTIAELTAVPDEVPVRRSPILAMNAEVDGVAPLFCIHAGFGTVFDYEPLARAMEGKRRVLALQSPLLLQSSLDGLAEQDMSTMASEYVGYIRERQPEGPYSLLGWSLGGTLALLIAGLLEGQGQIVKYLGVLDAFVPGVDGQEGDDWLGDLQGFLGVIQGRVPDCQNWSGEEQPQVIRSLIAEALSQQSGAEHFAARFGIDELAHVFQVARRLKRSSLRLDNCSVIRVQPQCWWTPERESAAQALGVQSGQASAMGEVVSCGHYEIPRHEDVLDALCQALAERTMVESV